MKNTPIRLIAFDLDGTILNSEKIITPRTLEALKAAADKGIILVPATGRTLATLSVVKQLPGLVEYAVTSNGAAVWAMGATPEAAVRSRWGENLGTPAGELCGGCECIALEALSCDKAIEVYDCLSQFRPGDLKVFVQGRSLCEPDSYAWEQQHAAVGFRTAPGLSTVVENLPVSLADHPGEAEKFCMFFRDDETLCAAREKLAKISDIEIVQGSPDNLEITAPGVDKGSGLWRLRRKLGIASEEVLAIGDSENDWAMLESVGCPAAVANATKETKARAKYISRADNDHDGAAELIEELALGSPTAWQRWKMHFGR
jgi:hydroxymethylpyrimidine pyrophosphatase-like HAD family hydrolase